MKKNVVNEIFILRSIACLAVVLVHSIESSLKNYGVDSQSNILTFVRMVLLFGTPTFIFISEFLLANAYPKDLPKGFFSKRLKVLLIPYVCMAIAYAVSEQNTFAAIVKDALINIFLAHFTVYFVIIIAQFYVLHFFLSKHLSRWSPKVVLPIALIINILYLGFFNFTKPFSFVPQGNWVWYNFSWLPFVGWIFYFALGYYCGRNYEQLKAAFSKYKLIILAAPILTLTLVTTLKYFGIPEIETSKRVDIIFHTTALIFAILYISSLVKKIPRFIYLISNYSFSIYLLHKLFLHEFTFHLNFINQYTFVPLVFVLSLVLSIVTSYLLNKLPFGKYIIGNVTNYGFNKKQSQQNKRVLQENSATIN